MLQLAEKFDPANVEHSKALDSSLAQAVFDSAPIPLESMWR